jgi:hypothetical protein
MYVTSYVNHVKRYVYYMSVTPYVNMNNFCSVLTQYLWYVFSHTELLCPSNTISPLIFLRWHCPVVFSYQSSAIF